MGPSAAKRVTLGFRVWAEALENGSLEIEVLDRHGRSPVALKLNAEEGWVAKGLSGAASLVKLSPAREKSWVEVHLQLDVSRRQFDVRLDGKAVLTQGTLAGSSGESVERLCFRTGPNRDYDAHQADLLIDRSKLGDRLDGDVKQPRLQVFIDDVRVASQ